MWWARQEVQAVATLDRMGASLFLTSDEGTGVRLPDRVLTIAMNSLKQTRSLLSAMRRWCLDVQRM